MVRTAPRSASATRWSTPSATWPAPRRHPTRTRTATRTRATSTRSQAATGRRRAQLLEKAQADFAAADQALQAGQGREWVRLTHQARVEVAKALNLLR